ncbi:MAG: flagellar export protein FliJ [Armatimonadetes bacterium]|nr:flagellar export protein FliJ [Armatimonadota bacterium]
MKRFEFPLESVLRLRRFAEAEARQALQEAVARRNSAEDALQRTRRQIADATARLAGGMSAMRAAEVVNSWRELDLLAETALKQEAILAECERDVAAKREAWVAAQQERKPLERLREEMHQSHQEDVERAEQVVTDEVAIIGFSRREKAP